MKGCIKLITVGLAITLISTATLPAMELPQQPPQPSAPSISPVQQALAQALASQQAQKQAQEANCCRSCCAGFLLCCGKTTAIIQQFSPAIIALAGVVVNTIPNMPNKEVAMQWINAIQVLDSNPATQALLTQISSSALSGGAQLDPELARQLAQLGVPVNQQGQITNPAFTQLVASLSKPPTSTPTVATTPTRSIEPIVPGTQASVLRDFREVLVEQLPIAEEAFNRSQRALKDN